MDGLPVTLGGIRIYIGIEPLRSVKRGQDGLLRYTDDGHQPTDQAVGPTVVVVAKGEGQMALYGLRRLDDCGVPVEGCEIGSRRNSTRTTP